MPRIRLHATLAVTAALTGAQAHAACGTLDLTGPADRHEAHFIDMDQSGTVSPGDGMIGQRTLNDASGTPAVDVFFTATVGAVDEAAGTAARPTNYVFDFGNGAVFGALDVTQPVADIQNPPGTSLATEPSRVPIQGGTGAYAGATGLVEFVVTEDGAAAYRFDFACDLVGTWVGATTILLMSEGQIVEAPRIHTIVIEEVSGNLIKGFRTWRSPTDDDPGYVGDLPTTDAMEPFFGSISADGDGLHLVEYADHGMLIGKVLGPNAIEFTYMEAAPHAVVYSAVYTRQQ
ncbi:MAG: hypothetical protein AAGH83_08980 [Pseudomonadota bacterium]